MSFNLNEEVIDGHLVTAETKKIWAVEMDLAQKLLDVCKKHNLRIWADGGTLLGAVRHKGFIPWDDDMDFVMMREDYDKLVEIGPQEFKEPYFFQSFYTDNFWGGMVKIRRSDTAMIEKDYKIHKDFNRGIFIDVFVLDAIPDERKELIKLFNKIRLFRRMLFHYKVVNSESFSIYGKIRHGLIMTYLMLKKTERIQQRIHTLLSHNHINENEYCGLLDFYALEGLSVSKIKFRHKCCYNDIVWLPFYEMQLPAPKEYHQLLTSLYGDYMKPVQGGLMHSNLIVDCDRSYKTVMEELKGRL